MTGSRQSQPRWGAARSTAIVLVVGLTLVGFVGTGPAGAQDSPFEDGPVSIGAAMSGEGGGVVASATTAFTYEDMIVVLDVSNPTGRPADVSIPPAVLLQPEDDTQQTVVTAEPVTDFERVSLDDGGTSYAVTVPPGESQIELRTFCGQEHDLGPFVDEPTTLSYAGIAAAPLPTVIDNIVQAEAPSALAQEAVWWVTDRPVVPIKDPAVESLLRGVDTRAFAHDPVQVVPDDNYEPEWVSARAGLSDEVAEAAEDASFPIWLAALGGLFVVLLGGGVWYAATRTAPASTRRPGGPPGAGRSGGPQLPGPPTGGWY